MQRAGKGSQVASTESTVSTFKHLGTVFELVHGGNNVPLLLGETAPDDKGRGGGLSGNERDGGKNENNDYLHDDDSESFGGRRERVSEFEWTRMQEEEPQIDLHEMQRANRKLSNSKVVMARLQFLATANYEGVGVGPQTDWWKTWHDAEYQCLHESYACSTPARCHFFTARGSPEKDLKESPILRKRF